MNKATAETKRRARAAAAAAPSHAEAAAAAAAVLAAGPTEAEALLAESMAMVATAAAALPVAERKAASGSKVPVADTCFENGNARAAYIGIQQGREYLGHTADGLGIALGMANGVAYRYVYGAGMRGDFDSPTEARVVLFLKRKRQSGKATLLKMAAAEAAEKMAYDLETERLLAEYINSKVLPRVATMVAAGIRVVDIKARKAAYVAERRWERC